MTHDIYTDPVDRLITSPRHDRKGFKSRYMGDTLSQELQDEIGRSIAHRKGFYHNSKKSPHRVHRRPKH